MLPFSLSKKNIVQFFCIREFFMNVKKITKTNLLTLLIISIVSGVTISSINFDTKEPLNVSISQDQKHLRSLESLSNHSEPNKTPYTLGYDSKYGALPDSLRGTTLDNALQVDEEGHLLISIDIKDLFDYFLSTISEEDLDIILLRVDEYLTHYLQEPALSESKAILAQYIEFKYSLIALEKMMGNDFSQMSSEEKRDGGYLNFLRKQMDQRNALREQYLDLAVYEVFYEEEQRYDEYTYSKLLVNSDKSLSASERLSKLTEFQNALPADVRQSMRETQITDELKIRTEKVLADGGDQQQVRELRREMFGDEAVQRFDELDQQRAQWDARINAYLIQRTSILSNQGLAQDELNSQVDSLRASLFDALEQVRVRSIERHAKA
jgi:lipase chaperone LimK